MRTAAAITVGFIIDIVAGDPDYPFHPVILMGKMIRSMERLLRRMFPEDRVSETAAGAIMAVMVTIVWYYIGYIFLRLAGAANTYVLFAAECLICYQCIAVKAMLKESRNVLENIKTGDIEKARKAVGRIVGRDTGALDMQGVIKADIECVAESLCDGVIGPLFYMALGGVPLALAYKAVNTMDSMVGYKNEKYLWFGRTAARLDDVANFIPSRIAAMLILLTGRKEPKEPSPRLPRKEPKEPSPRLPLSPFGIWRRDRYKHASPNSGQTEAAMAGVLGVRLGGNASYFGEPVEKEYIGDDIKSPSTDDIIKANRIFAVASVLGLILVTGIRALVYVNLVC